MIVSLKLLSCIEYVRLKSTSNPQIGVKFSNIWPFFTFSNRRPMTSHPLGNVFEAMMEKGQDQIPGEGFLMTKDKNAYVFYSYCK